MDFAHTDHSRLLIYASKTNLSHKIQKKPGFLEDRIANLGLIDFKLGLYIKVYVNAGKNKFEVHISKRLAKMAIDWHKIGQMPLLGKNINLA